MIKIKILTTIYILIFDTNDHEILIFIKFLFFNKFSTIFIKFLPNFINFLTIFIKFLQKCKNMEIENGEIMDLLK